MRLGVHIGIHAYGHRRDPRQQPGPRFEPLEFLCALDVEAPDAGLDGEVELRDGLADAGKDDAFGSTPCEQYAFQLPAGDDVEAGPKALAST